MMGCVESGQVATFCLSLQPEGRKSQYEKSSKGRDDNAVREVKEVEEVRAKKGFGKEESRHPAADSRL
jgi:hypothetical protein